MRSHIAMESILMRMHREPMLAAVLRRLDGTKGMWPEIAREADVPYQTLTKIACRIVTDPRVSTVQALYDYFERQPASAEAATPPTTTH